MNRISRTTQEFVETLDKLKDSDIDLNLKENWEDLWKELKKRNIIFHEYVAKRDLFGWYIKIYVLGRNGYLLKKITDYFNTKEEALSEIKDTSNYCIYKIMDKNIE